MNKENKDFILTKHVHDNGWNLFETYCDDGYSGANLDRPALQRMLQDVRDGHINTILVKDLSGLGRNYLDMGHLAEEFLPEHHRKLISFAEIVDDMVDLRNIINERLSEMHPKSWTIIPTEEGHFLT
ncbi:MAG: recombinase family protein [Bacteroidales bacterium]|nr:recombinase family protein [Bacteroidales bacterium]